MESTYDADGALPIPHEILSSNQDEFTPTERSANSSNDLGGRLMNLPFELKQRILYSLTPKERRHLRLVNKAMLDAVDASMSDVEDIEIRHDCKNVHRGDNHQLYMTTVNPYNGVKKKHYPGPFRSSLPFLLKWAGAQLETLDLKVFLSMSEYDDSHLIALYRVFESLTSENACPKLKNLSLDMGESLWESNENILDELLKYITKRQLQVEAIDRPTPFLHSLSLTTIQDCISTGTLHSEKRRRFLQDLLDQCHGLKELDVDSLLVQKDLPIVALRYPTTLTYLKTLRLGTTPGELSAITNNCPDLQIVDVDAGFPRDDTDVHALASLSDLRQLTLAGYSTEEKDRAQIISQCLVAFEDYPFGASVARPWTQLKSATLNCYHDDNYQFLNYRLLLSGANCCTTSLHLTRFGCSYDIPYARSVEQLFKALNSKDACQNLMELNINACELVSRIIDSLRIRKYRQQRVLGQGPDEFYVNPRVIFDSGPQVCCILNDLLTYVTRRQSENRLGKPFLRLLSIGKRYCFCDDRPGTWKDLDVLRDELEQIHTTIQQILDQCHGLEDLYMESLEHEWINPDAKKGKELMELVPLRFPMTLKKLNGVKLNNFPSNL